MWTQLLNLIFEHCEDLNSMRAEPAGVISISVIFEFLEPKSMHSKGFLPLTETMCTGQKGIERTSYGL